MDISDWRIKCLVAPSFRVVNVLANNSPVFEVEDFFSKNSIGVKKSVEDKPVHMLVDKPKLTEGFNNFILMRYTLSV